MIAIGILILLQCVVCAFFCSYVAKEKGKNGESWFIIGLLFGIIALIALIAIPSQSIKADTIGINQHAGGRTCPFCAEWVKREAIVCRYCNRELPAYQKDEYTVNPPQFVDDTPYPKVCPRCNLRYPEEMTSCTDCNMYLEAV
jgi:hypothetical protein